MKSPQLALAALETITSPELFPHITSFLAGVPVWTVEYEHNCGPKSSSISAHVCAKASMGTPGLLPRLAIQHGDILALERLYKLHIQPQFRRKGKFWFTRAMRDAAAFGKLEVLQWLFKNIDSKYHTLNVDEAAENGHADVVQWLIEHPKYSHCGPTERTLDIAASNGHFEVVRILYQYGWARSRRAMDGAAAIGRLDIVIFLHELDEACTTSAADKAATNGYLVMVQWLLVNRSEGVSDEAMYGALVNGHLDVVRYLWEFRHGQDGKDYEAEHRQGIKRAIPCLLTTSSVAVVTVAHEVSPEAFPPYALAIAARSGNIEVVKFLHANGRPRADVDEALVVATEKHPEIVKFLLANDSFSDEVLVRKARVPQEKKLESDVPAIAIAETKPHVPLESADHEAQAWRAKVDRAIQEERGKVMLAFEMKLQSLSIAEPEGDEALAGVNCFLPLPRVDKPTTSGRQKTAKKPSARGSTPLRSRSRSAKKSSTA